MTDTKFTSAPWHVTRDAEGFTCIADASGRFVEVFSKKNAHLIAAAPRMYEALEAAATVLEAHGLETVRVVRRALSEARGEVRS